MSEEIGELIQQINNLRDKQLNGGGLSDNEVREGIRLLNQIRAIRASTNSGTSTAGVKKGPPPKLEDMF